MTWKPIPKGYIPPDSPWTASRTLELTDHWIGGLSCSQIASILGGGITRNSVIGKVHRMGLHNLYPRKARKSPQPRVPPKAKKPKRTRHMGPPDLPPSLPPREDAWKPLAGTSPVTLMELGDGTCRWPVGEGKPFLYCGCPPVPGSPYCATHKAMGTTPLKPKSQRGEVRLNFKGAFYRGMSRILEDA